MKPEAKSSEFPTVFLLGTPRSGSTLFMQWASSLGVFAYPSNFMSRFNRSPYIGGLIYKMVTDSRFQYKNEFADINRETDFKSTIGKTKGFTAPHEFWYFWRRFMEFRDVPVQEEIFNREFDFQTFEKELNLLKNLFEKPFIMKGQILNWYLETLPKKLKNCLYIHLYRNPIDVCRSLLDAREQWFGSRNVWFSAKPREFEMIKEMDVYHQIAGQVYFINKEIFSKRMYLKESYLMVNYEDFCSKPSHIYDRVLHQLKNMNSTLKFQQYDGINHFTQSNRKSSDDNKLEKAYRYYEDKFGIINQ
ncbi:MAG: sulfotransferase [Balneolaceae bacterium]|nr:sulfotransferase [Balneolaceae bacterium]